MHRHDAEMTISVTLSFCAQKNWIFDPLLKTWGKKDADTVKVSYHVLFVCFYIHVYLMSTSLVVFFTIQLIGKCDVEML